IGILEVAKFRQVMQAQAFVDQRQPFRQALIARGCFFVRVIGATDAGAGVVAQHRAMPHLGMLVAHRILGLFVTQERIEFLKTGLERAATARVPSLPKSREGLRKLALYQEFFFVMSSKRASSAI